MIFILKDDPASKSLAQKLAKHGKSGAIIQCTEEELEASKQIITIPITPNGINQPQVFEMQKDGKYLLFCDRNQVDKDELNLLIRQVWEMDRVSIGVIWYNAKGEANV